MPATITTAKGTLLLLALLCAVFQWQGLRSHLSYQSYHQLAADAGRGRLQPQDAGWIEGFLQRPEQAGGYAAPQLQRTAALLQLYRIDLIAASKGVSPRGAAGDSDLSAARLKAAASLRAALSRRPLDGDLWLRLALTAKDAGLAEETANRYLQLSRDTTPHEGWIMRRRPPDAR